MLLPAPLGPSTSVAWPASSGASARARLGAVAFSASSSTSTPIARVGLQALARRGEGRQVALVEDDARRDRRRLGGDQRARELRLAEHRLGRDDDEQLVDVGGERLGLPFVLAVEQVARAAGPARSRLRRPTPASARGRRRRRRSSCRAGGRGRGVPSASRRGSAGRGPRRRARCRSAPARPSAERRRRGASALAAQMKSLTRDAADRVRSRSARRSGRS